MCELSIKFKSNGNQHPHKTIQSPVSS